jgi:hypothetical protein
MTTTEAPIDITAPPAAPPAAHNWKPLLPWALFGITAVALLAVLLPKPGPLPVEPPREPEIATESTGLGENLWIHRGEDGRIRTVVWVVHPNPVFPDLEAEASCKILADGVVVAEATNDGAAVCVWVR